MTLHVSILNRSGLVSETQARAMTRGVRAQVQQHFAPLWNMVPPEVRYYPDAVSVPNDSAIITIRDSSDVPDALGDHDQDDVGRPRGEVLVKVILDNGGSILDTDLSVSSVLSHETLELVADPYIVDWSQGWDGVLFSREVCDPVEADSYFIETTRRGEFVTVSNFVTPFWFTTDPPPHSFFDKLGKLDRPFDLTSGGYVIKMEAGKLDVEYGAEYPEWKKSLKDPLKRRLGRTARRIRGAGK